LYALFTERYLNPVEHVRNRADKKKMLALETIWKKAFRMQCLPFHQLKFDVQGTCLL